MQNLIFRKISLGVFFIGISLLYLHNLSRSVYGGDVGDLVTAAYVGGVAHPPGYPFFTFLGFLIIKIFSHILSPAGAVGLISVSSAVIGVIACYYLAYALSKKMLPSLFVASVLAFSYFFWLYAEIAEVFMLNVCFAIVLFLLAYLFKKQQSTVLLLSFWLVLGLSLIHHQTIVLIFPSLAILIGKEMFFYVLKNKLSLVWIFIPLFIGILPIIYIPIASSHNPIINWDNVHSIPSFFHLILRKDYGTFQAGLFDAPTMLQRFVALKTYGFAILTQLTIPITFLSILGIIILWRQEKRVAIAILLAFIFTGPFFIFYAGFPLTDSFIFGVYERFFLLSTIFVIIPVSVGIDFFANYLAKLLGRPMYYPLFQSLFFLIPLTLFFSNFPKTNLSDVFVGDTLGKDMLITLPKNTILVFSGDTVVFNTWYVRYALHQRQDISLYNLGGGSEGGPLNEFIHSALKPYSKKERGDGLVHTFKNLSLTRPVYSTVLLEPSKGEKITWIPYGLSYEMVTEEVAIPSEKNYLDQTEKIWKQLHTPSPEDTSSQAMHNLTIVGFPLLYSNALLATGDFIYSQYNDKEEALQFYQKAQTVSPENEKVYETIGVFQLGVEKDCQGASKNFQQAIQLNQFEKLPYFLLYKSYQACQEKQSVIEGVIETYSQTFKSDFIKDLKTEAKDIKTSYTQ